MSAEWKDQISVLRSQPSLHDLFEELRLAWPYTNSHIPGIGARSAEDLGARTVPRGVADVNLMLILSCHMNAICFSECLIRRSVV